MDEAEPREFFRCEEVHFGKFFHELIRVLYAWDVFVDKIKCDVHECNQIAILVGPVHFQLHFGTKHVVPAKVLVFLLGFIKNQQFLADAEIEDREFNLTILRLARANVLRL